MGTGKFNSSPDAFEHFVSDMDTILGFDSSTVDPELLEELFQCSEIYLVSPKGRKLKHLFKGMDDIIQVARQRVTEIQHNLERKQQEK